MVMHDAFQRAFSHSLLAASRFKLDSASKKLQIIFNQSSEPSSPVQELPSHAIIRTWWGVKISPSYATAHTTRLPSNFLNVFPPCKNTFRSARPPQNSLWPKKKLTAAACFGARKDHLPYQEYTIKLVGKVNQTPHSQVPHSFSPSLF